MDSMIGNSCLELVSKIARSKGKEIYVADLYVVPTWLAHHSNPLLSMPNDIRTKEFIIIPIWTPGHYQLCVLKPVLREILLLDSRCFETPYGFDQRYTALLRDLAQRINPGEWTEKTGYHFEKFPRQTSGNDCGVFMIMVDMPALRRWWCIMLMENFTLDNHGKLFSHWTNEAMDLLKGHRQPVMRLRKRKFEEMENIEDIPEARNWVTQNIEHTQEARNWVTQNIEDMQEARNWVTQLKKQNLFKGEVHVPRFLAMEDSEAVQALENFIVNGDTFNTDEKHEVMDPFIFNFEYVEDVELFFEKIGSMNIKVNYGMLNRV
ncbi:uncharacterized protein LOC121713559 isoform X2 [Alosa sapidissima]|uniref:uncharacterized protein LOC121713559 isoform X2 n=1 Tax=Alosa sapidissima TaxID=34773 RepID=UPI001C095374|nr:uncharacterized protein LOC121713559 isoform X2 [Alosa sapidissima]